MDTSGLQGGGGGGLPAPAARDGGGARRVIGCAVLAVALVAIVIAILLWTGVVSRGGGLGTGGQAASGTGAAGQKLSPGEAEVADAERKLGRLQDELNHKLVPAIAKLQSDRDDVKAKLKAAGVADSKGLKDNFRAQSLGQELAEVVGLIRVMEQKRAAYERSGFELESLIRRLKRKNVAEDAGLTDQEMAEVTATLKTIDAQLADVTQAPPELNPAQFDALIDEELGSATLDGKIARQIELREARLSRLTERAAALKSAATETASRVAEVENFRSRVQRAYTQALDEERWPIKVAGRVFDRIGAERALARAQEYVAAQKDVPAMVAPVAEKVDAAVSALQKEVGELKGLQEQAKGLAIADPRASEIKSRVTVMAESGVEVSKDPLLGPVPAIEPFDPVGK